MRKTRIDIKENGGSYKPPKTRRRQFADISRYGFSFVINTSLMTALFFVPALALGVFCYTVATGVAPTMANISPLIFWCAIGAIPLIAVGYLGKVGAFGVMQNRALGSGSFAKQEFFKRIKEGGGRAFLFGLIVGLSFAAALYGSFMLAFLPMSPVPKGLAIGALLLQNLIVYIAGEYFLCVHNMYTLPFSACAKNGFSLCMSKLPMSAACYIVKIGVFAACVMLSSWSALAIVAAAVLFNGFFTLAETLYSCRQFDEYINKDNYPEFYCKGLDRE